MILQPPAALLLGSPGVGKTDSLATLIEAGLEVFSIITEPDGVASLIDSCTRRRLPIDKLHWTTCVPAAVGMSALQDMITTIGSYSYEDITKIKQGVGKDETRKPAMKLLLALSNFHCERTGRDYGSFPNWKDDVALCFDSLSGLNLIAMALTIGFKPAAHQGEWGVAMNFVEQLLLKLTADRQCFLVVTGHIEKEMSELTGVNQIMASTLGRKLAPKIPRFFSEVIRAERLLEGTGPAAKFRFKWSTIDRNMDLKNRSLPISDNLEPSFKPIVDAYRRRKTLAEASGPEPQTTTATPPAMKELPVAPMRPTTPVPNKVG